MTISTSRWPWAKQSGPLLPLPHKRSNIPVGCLRLSPHLAAETVIEVAGKSTKPTRVHTHQAECVCVLCETSRARVCATAPLTEWDLTVCTNTIKYQSVRVCAKLMPSATKQVVWGAVWFSERFLTFQPSILFSHLNKEKGGSGKYLFQGRNAKKKVPSSQLRSFFSSSTPSFSNWAKFVSISFSSLSICSAGIW